MYKTITDNTNYELVEKKSKFIANLIYIEDKADAENKIKELKKKFYDARHNCYAYRVLDMENIYEKSSDDGEPSGTAGAPMLNILQKNNLVNCLIVVTRYFGGILLGTGGLVRSYSGATTGAIDKSKTLEIELGVEYEIKLEYSEFQAVQYYSQKNNIRITDTKYEQYITCYIEMNNNSEEKFLKNIENKEIKLKEIKKIKNKYVKV